MIKKSRFIVSLFLVMLLSLSMGIILSAVKAEAKNIYIAEGAAVRLDDPSGLRFTGKIDKSQAETAEKIGMIIAPYSFLSDESKYSDGVVGNYQNLIQKIDLNFPMEKLYENPDEEGYYCFNGVLSNVLFENYNRQFTAISYYVHEGVYHFSDINESDNARSFAYVVGAAYDSKKYEHREDMLLNFIEKGIYESVGVTESEGGYYFEDVFYDSFDKLKSANAYTLESDVQELSLSLLNSEASIVPSIKVAEYSAEINVRPVFSTGDPSVADVDEFGKVTAVGAGSTNITISVLGLSKTVEVRVSEKCEIDLSAQKMLFSKYDGATESPVLDVKDAALLTSATVKLDGEVFENYTVAGSVISFDAVALKSLANGEYELRIETHDSIITSSIYICDVVITAENANDYFTDSGAKSLAVSHTVVYPDSDLMRLNMHYVLAADLDLSGKSFRGIAKSNWRSTGLFGGVFDGNGHVIKNWQPSTALTSTCGFIAVSKGGKIYNLGLENITLDIKGTEQCFVGGLVGAMENTVIANCYIKDMKINITDNFTVRTMGGVFGTSNNGHSYVENVIVYGNISVSGAADYYGIGYIANNASRLLTVKNVYIANEGFSDSNGLLPNSAFITNENSLFKTSEELLQADYSMYLEAKVWSIIIGQIPVMKPIYE